MGAQGLEAGVHRPGQVGFLQRQPMAGVADYVGVGGRRRRIAHARHKGQVFVEIGGPHEAVAIAGLTVPKADRVQHAGSREPMVAEARSGIHAGAHIVAAQLTRYLAADDQRPGVDLVKHGRPVALKMPRGDAVGPGRCGHWRQFLLRSGLCPGRARWGAYGLRPCRRGDRHVKTGRHVARLTGRCANRCARHARRGG